MNRHQPSGRLVLGLFFALLTTIIWGGLPIVTKLMLAQLDVFTLAWIRFLTSGVLMAPILIQRYGLVSLLDVKKAPVIMAACVVGLAGNYLLYMAGLRFLSPGTAQVVMQLSPMMVLFGGLVIFRERLGRIQWLGFGVLIVGQVLFFNQRFDALAGEVGVGLLFIVAAAIFWSGYILAQKQMQSIMPPEAILLVIYFSCVVVMLPLAQPLEVVSLSGYYVGLLVLLATMTVTSYICFGSALNHIEASRSGIIIALTPITTIIMSYVLIALSPDTMAPESLNVLSWVGALVVVVGSMMGALGNSEAGTRVKQATL